MPANPDVIVLADVATLVARRGRGRFWTGWTTAASCCALPGPGLPLRDISRDREDPLMPVRLRAGGRSVGGAMSWGEPKALARIRRGQPFFGLEVPPDVTVSAQVMAQPDPALADRVIAQLTDGTPLVTRKKVGQGQIVLFHVTANAEWSSLPLSGLFVQMLERLAIAAGSGAQPEPRTWKARSGSPASCWTPLAPRATGHPARCGRRRPDVGAARARICAPVCIKVEDRAWRATS